MTFKNILNLEKLKYETESMGDHYESACAPLATEMGAKKLGFHAEILPPKKFSCPYHFHHAEEELFLVLEGKAMLRQAGRFREVSQGDLIFFENSPEGAHQFYNHTDRPFRFLALSTKEPLEVCEYPDSKKIMVGQIRKIFQADSAVEYFKDEIDPTKYWPKV